MSYFDAVLLALIQALTEFLPVSSSGHLVVSQQLLGLRGPLVAFDVLLHVGTLLAVIVFYRRELWSLGVSAVAPSRSPGGRRLLLRLMVASIPAAVIGFGFQEFLEEMFSSAAAVGMFWILTAGLLFAASRMAQGSKTTAEMSVADAWLIGLFQGVAILPGVSRSGTTIIAGIMCGLHPRRAADFSFLMFIPAMAGATLLQLDDLSGLGSQDVPVYVLGAVVAAVASYVTIWFFLRLLQRRILTPFAWYCLAAGAATLAVTAAKL